MEPTDRFADAVAWATRLHARQTRKLSGAPYLSHLLRVTGIALEYGADEDEAIAAVLHDAIEDQGGARTREEIARRYGPRVAEIVSGCSDTDQTPKPPWRERKEAYLAHLAGASPSVRLISASDKLDNVRDLLAAYRAGGESIWAHFRGGRDGALWYHRSVVNLLKAAGPSRLAEELDLAVTELERVCATGFASISVC